METANLFDTLEGADIGAEINPLGYDPADYSDLETVIRHLRTRRKIVGVDLPKLAVNGEVIRDSFEKYLGSKHLGSSSLKEIHKTPLHFWCALHEPKIRQSKKAFDLGSWCHMAFLEPSRFERVVTEPQANMATLAGVEKLLKFWEKKLENVRLSSGDKMVTYCKRLAKRAKWNTEKLDGKKALIRYYRERSGFSIVDGHTMGIIKLIRRHYYAYGGGILPELMKGAPAECSFYGNDPETGLPVKVRPDAFQLAENVGANIIISFKTTPADSISKFAYDAAKYRYQMAEAMYLDVVSQVSGRKFTGVITVMLQTVAPYLPAVFWWDAEHLAAGKYMYRTALQSVKSCYEKGMFPGFDAHAAHPDDMGIIPLSLPEWSLRELTPVGA
ncbi:PD-(D/E)XK nuclease-like domain-containing protein [Spirosoma litoris]